MIKFFFVTMEPQKRRNINFACLGKLLGKINNYYGGYNSIAIIYEYMNRT